MNYLFNYIVFRYYFGYGQNKVFWIEGIDTLCIDSGFVRHCKVDHLNNIEKVLHEITGLKKLRISGRSELFVWDEESGFYI